MANFSDLPSEVRVLIYRHLFKGTRLVYCPDGSEDFYYLSWDTGDRLNISSTEEQSDDGEDHGEEGNSEEAGPTSPSHPITSVLLASRMCLDEARATLLEVSCINIFLVPGDYWNSTHPRGFRSTAMPTLRYASLPLSVFLDDRNTKYFLADLPALRELVLQCPPRSGLKLRKREHLSVKGNPNDAGLAALAWAWRGAMMPIAEGQTRVIARHRKDMGARFRIVLRSSVACIDLSWEIPAPGRETYNRWHAYTDFDTGMMTIIRQQSPQHHCTAGLVDMSDYPEDLRLPTPQSE